MSSDVELPHPRDVSVPDQKAVMVTQEADVMTVCNALEAAKETEALSTDAAALVELAESYTGWSP